MPDDAIHIFESSDSLVIQTVAKALRDAGIAHEVRFDRPTIAQYGPNKPPRRIIVAAEDEAAAREIAESAAARRQRMSEVDAESRRLQRYASPSRDNGGGDAGFFIGGSWSDGGSDCGGGDGGGCGD